MVWVYRWIEFVNRSVNNLSSSEDCLTGYCQPVWKRLWLRQLYWLLTLAMNSIKCFEKRDTSEKLTLNCGVTAALCHSALACSESDDWPVHTRFIGKLKPWHLYKLSGSHSLTAPCCVCQPVISRCNNCITVAQRLGLFKVTSLLTVQCAGIWWYSSRIPFKAHPKPSYQVIVYLCRNTCTCALVNLYLKISPFWISFALWCWDIQIFYIQVLYNHVM